MSIPEISVDRDFKRVFVHLSKSPCVMMNLSEEEACELGHALLDAIINKTPTAQAPISHLATSNYTTSSDHEVGEPVKSQGATS